MATTGLNDEQWQKIVALLQKYTVSLQVLNLFSNYLKNFIPPPNIAALIALDLYSNAITNIPLDVVKLGNTAILQWLKDTGKRPVLEAKVMFIGDSNYGKTTLISMLQNGKAAKSITTTHGIERCRIRDAEAARG
ncbi:MAG: hypothetical protein ACTFAK_08180 [Candidatus Electronema sp. VV]